MLLEICVDDAAGVHAAVEGGADRIELCAALDIGGITPAPGLVELAVECGIPVRVMIRPRGGGFQFDAVEERQMHRDIAAVLGQGVEGLVLGASRADGRLDQALLARQIAYARDRRACGLTLHRAIDLAPDLDEAIDCAATLGFDQVLTSGGASSAVEGAPAIARMRRRAPAALGVIAGAGITPALVPRLVADTRVTAIHASGRARSGEADPRLVRFGFAVASSRRADVGQVRALRRALDAITAQAAGCRSRGHGL